MVRQRKSPDVRRAEILDRATQLFVERGIERVSISDIAQHVGIAKGLLYHYFASKDELVLVLRERYLTAWYTEVAALLSDVPTGEEAQRYEHFVRSLYEFHAGTVAVHRLLLTGAGAEEGITAT